MNNKILFLTLRVFSAKGGIEKVCCVFGKALQEICTESQCSLQILSSHDKTIDAVGNQYFPIQLFSGFGNNRFLFVLNAFLKGIQSNLIVISHVNLLPVGWLIKKIAPNRRLVMLAHGIEIWSLPLGIKKKMLNACDEILCVSQFTKDKIAAFPISKNIKLTVLNNCIDPYLESQYNNDNIINLRKKYNIDQTDKVLFTLARLDANERYKGYDRVIMALAAIEKKTYNFKYIIGGSSDEIERNYVLELIKKHNLEGRVILTGFIPDEDLKDYFQMSDLYIMPSLNEGFGIVFIEAMFYGVPVIAGNTDGSVDALLNGALGQLVNPTNVDEIKNAIISHLETDVNRRPDYNLLMTHFSYDQYKKKLLPIILN